MKKIIIYNLRGRFLGYIPIPESVPKARFKIDTERQTLTILILPFKNRNQYAILYIDFEGNIINSLDSPPYALEPDFGNEVISYRNTDNIDYYIMGWPNERDSLFYYLPNENILQPVFTFNFGNTESFRRWYIDLPNHVLTIRAEQERQDVNGVFYAPQRKMIIVDKRSMRGGWVKLVIDELGNIPIPSHTYPQDGYFIVNMYPHELKQHLGSVLSKNINHLTQEQLNKIRSLYNQIDEDGNNIVIWGRLKR